MSLVKSNSHCPLGTMIHPLIFTSASKHDPYLEQRTLTYFVSAADLLFANLNSAALLCSNYQHIHLFGSIQRRKTGGKAYSDTFPYEEAPFTRATEDSVVVLCAWLTTKIVFVAKTTILLCKIINSLHLKCTNPVQL